MVQVFRQPKRNGKRTGAAGKRSRNSAGIANRNSQGNSNHQAAIEVVAIDAMDHEAKGVVRGKQVTFVPGAISGEQCKITPTNKSQGVRQARLTEILEASEHRQQPFCPHYQECGGCHTQHIRQSWWLAEKQHSLSYLLQKQTGLGAADLPWHDPIQSSEKGYRRKARLAIDARQKDALKLGFRNETNQVFNLRECQVLTPELNALIKPLQQLLKDLPGRKNVGHIQLFKGDDIAGDNAEGSSVFLTIRLVKNLTAPELEMLRIFSTQYQCQICLELNDKQFVSLFAEKEGATAGYGIQLPESYADVRLRVKPNEFVQVNPQINQKMIEQAIRWLSLEQTDRVLDLFCGIGNFTLPLARYCTEVVGFEGVPEMVQSARYNAQLNSIENVTFLSGDLESDELLHRVRQQKCNKVLLDPARDGAYKAMDSLIAMAPELILYVSCNPATFGRDIAKLLDGNYVLTRLSLIDMFPNTAHSEMMGLFVYRP